jgi:UDP-N-acetylglucosamine acyltransferase
MVDPKAQVDETARIGAYTCIGPQVEIGPNCSIDHHVNIDQNTKIGEGTRIWPFASLGTDPQDLKYGGETTWLEVGKNVMIREFATLNRGTGEGGGVTRVGDNCLLMAYSHVAHDCQIGDNVIMANSANLGGHCVLENNCAIGGLTAVHQFTRIGAYCFVGGMSGVAQDLPPYTLCEGNRAKTHGLNQIGLKRSGFSEETIRALKKAYRIIFRSHITLKEALPKVREEVEDLPEVRHFLEFIQTSTRGVAR